MTLVLATPGRKRGQKFWPSFDEDELTLAWSAVQGLAPGTAVRTEGLELPAWFWAGTGLRHDATALLVLRPIATTVGALVALHDGPLPDVEKAAQALYAKAPTQDEAAWQRHRMGRDAPDGEADFPLGAFVPAARHEQVLAERMRLPPGRVASWTTIGPGAAPAEFTRLQDAVGAYHVMLVEAGGKRTVGLWAGPGAPRTGQAVKPVLRRLFRTQGAWRHGIKFQPADT